MADLGEINVEETFTNGMNSYDEEEFEDALELFNDVIRAEKDHHEAYNMLGMTFAALELPREAWRSFKHALRTDENDKNTLFYIADFLADQGDFEMAKYFAERYLEMEHDKVEREEMTEILERVETHLEAGDRGTFTADLNLNMEDLVSVCGDCKTRLPYDAPYCAICGAAHIYQEDADEFEGYTRESDWDEEEEDEEAIRTEDEELPIKEVDEEFEEDEDKY